jgi:outer membrane protein insertion porin family
MGGISPAWINGSPLGARNALIFTTELTFPLVKDYSMKGHLFYDAGAGWSTPKNDIYDTNLILRDKCNLRHAVGFGFNLTNPVPAKIDWGYKLDRKPGETASEFHLSMNYAF